jgi:hypothetical protein
VGWVEGRGCHGVERGGVGFDGWKVERGMEGNIPYGSEYTLLRF